MKLKPAQVKVGDIIGSPNRKAFFLVLTIKKNIERHLLKRNKTTFHMTGKAFGVADVDESLRPFFKDGNIIPLDWNKDEDVNILSKEEADLIMLGK